MRCWPEAWRESRLRRALTFPVAEAEEAEAALLDWLAGDEAVEAAWSQDIGFAHGFPFTSGKAHVASRAGPCAR